MLSILEPNLGHLSDKTTGAIHPKTRAVIAGVHSPIQAVNTKPAIMPPTTGIFKLLHWNMPKAVNVVQGGSGQITTTYKPPVARATGVGTLNLHPVTGKVLAGSSQPHASVGKVSVDSKAVVTPPGFHPTTQKPLAGVQTAVTRAATTTARPRIKDTLPNISPADMGGFSLSGTTWLIVGVIVLLMVWAFREI